MISFTHVFIVFTNISASSWAKPENGFKLKTGFDFRWSVSVRLTFWLQLYCEDWDCYSGPHIDWQNMFKLLFYSNIRKQDLCFISISFDNTVEPHYNEDLGTMKITLLYRVAPKKRNSQFF